MRSMNYNQARAKYWKKKIENPLPPLPEDERIYLNVPYMARDFARYSHCGFDPDRKLWFTGCMNANLYFLVDLYGVNEATSEKALALMKGQGYALHPTSATSSSLAFLVGCWGNAPTGWHWERCDLCRAKPSSPLQGQGTQSAKRLV